MLRRCALVALVLLPAGCQAANPFSRAAQELSKTASTLGSAIFDMVGGGSSEVEPSAFQAKVDAWATNPTLKMGRRLMKMGGLDGMGSLMEEMAFGKELEQVFSDPVAAHTVITRFPLFQAFAGVKDLAAKDVNDFTKADGLKVLDSFRAFAKKGVAGMLLMADPGRYAEFLSRYADQAEATDEPLTERDRHVRKLLAGVKAGNREAAVQFHDLVAQDVWGGTVDLEAFGSKGVEPPTLKELRELAMADSDMWSLITQGDPLVEKILSTPSLAFEVVPEFEATAPEEL